VDTAPRHRDSSPPTLRGRRDVTSERRRSPLRPRRTPSCDHHGTARGPRAACVVGRSATARIQLRWSPARAGAAGTGSLSAPAGGRATPWAGVFLWWWMPTRSKLPKSTVPGAEEARGMVLGAPLRSVRRGDPPLPSRPAPANAGSRPNLSTPHGSTRRPLGARPYSAYLRLGGTGLQEPPQRNAGGWATRGRASRPGAAGTSGCARFEAGGDGGREGSVAANLHFDPEATHLDDRDGGGPRLAILRGATVGPRTHRGESATRSAHEAGEK